MTIPACISCNSSFQKDEQLVAAIISTVSFTPEDVASANDGWLAKTKARDSRIRQFIDSRMTSDGYFQPDDLTIRAISKVAVKTAVGLLFYEYGRVVQRQDVAVLGIDHAKRIDPNAFIENFRIPSGWAEVTPSGKQLERQVQAAFGISPKGATPWREFLPEFFEYKFISGLNSKLLIGLKFHDAILVVLESPRPSSAGPNRTSPISSSARLRSNLDYSMWNGQSDLNR